MKKLAESLRAGKAALAPRLQKIWSRRFLWLRVLVLSFLGLAAEYVLDGQNALLHLRYWLYHVQTDILSPAGDGALNTAFVAIDDQAYWLGDYAYRAPLRRDQLAILVNAIAQANPRAIVLDIDFRSPLGSGNGAADSHYNDETTKLRNALKDAAKTTPIVLARSVDTGSGGELVEQADIFDNFSFAPYESNVYRGYIQLEFDLRKIAPCIDAGGEHNLDSLSLAMLQAAYPTTYKEIARPGPKGCTPAGAYDIQYGRFIARKKFEESTYAAETVLNSDKDAMRALHQSVVMLCGTWHTHSYRKGPQIDLHDSPADLIPGAYVHANYFEAMVHNHRYPAIGQSAGYALELVAILLAAAFMLRVHSVAGKLAIAFAPALLMIGFSYLLLQNLGAFFECTIPVLVLGCHVLVEKIVEWRSDAAKYGALEAAAEQRQAAVSAPASWQRGNENSRG